MTGSRRTNLRTFVCALGVAQIEIEDQEAWQSAVIAAVTVSPHRAHAEQVLQRVEQEAASILGPVLLRAGVEWLS